jgi:succinate dehydrogenase / fumarate reductase cytochrome b subunit
MSDIQQHRPLSPHVGIYRWQITNTLSILHRITGFGLVLGLVPLAAWLWGAAYDGAVFAWISTSFATLLGKLLLTGWMLAFYYHLANGMRHLNWDTGRGFTLPEVLSSGRLVVITALSLTIFTWAMVYKTFGV